MKVPLSWLRRYVEIDDTIEGLSDKLTFSGTEVEAVTHIGSDYAGLVVGETLDVSPHPNADRLSLCKVTDGNETFQVVCGAPDVTTGAKYVFAPVGASLPGGMKLKKAKIRGCESMGMLCAEDELGLSEDHSGLLRLDDHLLPGTAAAEVLPEPDIVFELEVTPNRPDCLSMIGIARELAALYHKPLQIPSVDFETNGQPVERFTSVTVEEAELCPRYSARMLDKISIAPSPAWMQRLLSLAGIRPINNIVDVTNFVLLECGHPLHAFDHSRLKDGRIVVRKAREQEKITTLDDLQHELSGEMLVIADTAQPVAIAGVMGGTGSEVRDDTQTVLLESAYFQPASVRHTAKQLGIHTDSSYRFARGTNIMGVDWASRRAASLMQQYGNAEIAERLIDIFYSPPTPTYIQGTTERLNKLLGIDVDISIIQKTMESLELKFEQRGENQYTVEVPAFRLDLEREVDLIEEFSRTYGLDQIPAPSPQALIVADTDDSRVRSIRKCRELLTGLGLSEICNYSLVSPSLLDRYDTEQKAERIVMPHPISADQSILRTSLIPQMIESLARNNARQMDTAALFEMGRIFTLQDTVPVQEENLSIGIMGAAGKSSLHSRNNDSADEAFLRLKGIVISLAKKCSLPAPVLKAESGSAWADGYGFECVCGKVLVGRMGILSREIRRELRFKSNVAVAELRLDPLLEHLFDIHPFKPFSMYPATDRDLAIIVSQSVRYEQIKDVIRDAAPPELENCTVFDIFTGDEIGEGLKSMAVTVRYRSSTETLTDDQVNVYDSAIRKALTTHLDAAFRE